MITHYLLPALSDYVTTTGTKQHDCFDWMDGVNVMVRARYRVSRMVELMLCTCVAITQSCSEETVGRLLVVTSIGG